MEKRYPFISKLISLIKTNKLLKKHKIGEIIFILFLLNFVWVWILLRFAIIKWYDKLIWIVVTFEEILIIVLQVIIVILNTILFIILITYIII